MKHKYGFVIQLLLIMVVVGGILTGLYLNYGQGEKKSEKLVVVTSFYPMYIATSNLLSGCKDIELKNLSEPQTGCLHDYQLTPEDMKLLSTADYFVVNGGGIESFLSKVAKAYPKLKIINTCEEIELKEDNAHAWMSLQRYMEQVTAIEKGMSGIHSEDREIIQKNTQKYRNEIQALSDSTAELTQQTQGKNIILFHEAFGYLAQDYGMNISYVMDLDEERQVSAGEVADVIAAVKDNNVAYIFAEELYGKALGDVIEKETTAQVLYLNPLVRGAYEKDAYLKGMEDNIAILKEAFR
ncbi:MAG: metal ABC transporter substrate-binding protein [Lachnospiraceae bacterium]